MRSDVEPKAFRRPANSSSAAVEKPSPRGPAASGSVFYGNLEALRGVAALAVAFGHCFLIPQFPARAKAGFELALCFMNGRAAVSVFFVLSGFVLTLAMRRSAGPRAADYAVFEIRRCFRILPAFLIVAAAICLSARLFLPLPFPSWSSEWFHTNYAHRPVAVDIVRHLLLLDTKLNVVSWTLRVELVTSMLFPFMVWTSRALPLGGKMMFQLPMLALGWWFRNTTLHPHGYCVGFLWPFYLGVLIAELGPGFWKRLRPAAAWWLSMAGWAILLGSRLSQRPTAGLICEQFGAFVVVGGLVHGPPNWVGRALDHRAAKFYGRISYCFYLAHFAIMYGLVFVITPVAPAEEILNHPFIFAGLTGVVSTGVATLAAWLLHISVEQPCIRFSKQICARWSAPETVLKSSPG